MRMGRVQTSQPFDENKARRRLTNLAAFYFWDARVKEERLSTADRVARLRALVRSLGRAHEMIDKAMQDDVGDDLYEAWCEDNVDDEFKKAVASVAVLEAAAHKAADHIRVERGRPKGMN